LRERSRRPNRPSASSEAVRRRMLVTLRRDTPGELALRSIAHRLGLRFRVDWTLPGMRRRADLAFIRARVIVFVDGCFWHGCPEHGTWPKIHATWWREKIFANRRRDSDTDRRLKTAGWAVIRMWTHEDPEACARKLVRVVGARRRIMRQ
jgi:DNA mismatch endonuclease (patch repair protein)